MNANPYASPPVVETPTFAWRVKATLRELAHLLIVGPLIGAVIGGAINSMNGLVSPYYFEFVMGWKDYVWLRSVGQGVLEGAIYAFMNAILLIGIAIFYSRAKIQHGLVHRTLVLISVLVVVFSLLGGSAGAIEQLLEILPFTGSFANAITSGETRYGWVFGTILFACYGSPFATLAGVAYFVLQQRRELRQTSQAVPAVDANSFGDP